MKINRRNTNGVKDSANCYLTISQKHWRHFTDFRLNREDNSITGLTKENVKDEISQLENEYKDMEFKYRKISGVYRIYAAQK